VPFKAIAPLLPSGLGPVRVRCSKPGVPRNDGEMPAAEVHDPGGLANYIDAGSIVAGSAALALWHSSS
jgi:hypothetical protein